MWRGEVFVEENAAGERSSGTQVTGKAGTPATGAAGAAQARAGVGWEGGRGEDVQGGGRAAGTPEPCRHQRSSVGHRGSADPAEGSATGEVSSQGSQQQPPLPHLRSPPDPPPQAALAPTSGP